MKRVSFTITLCFMLLFYSSMATATLIMTNDKTYFEALGTFTYNYGFDDFNYYSYSGFSYPGDPWTSHGVTYTSQKNLIIGYTPLYTTNGTSMMTNNFWNPVIGDVDSSAQYDLFGFDAGFMNQDDKGTTITITTNLNSYQFVVDLNSAAQTNFYGFVVGSGEYGIGFNIRTNDNSAVAGMDNVTLGHQNSVPEPSTILLMGIGLLGLVGYSRKCSKKS